jgi:hypothetical protein
MTSLISFPFRIGANGHVVTRDEDDPAYYAELLGQLVATRLGERVLVPEFGLQDPTFTNLDAQELAYKVEVFGPPVRINAVTEEQVGDNTVNVRVEFIPLESEAETVKLDEM